jgi:hypothetical protein
MPNTAQKVRPNNSQSDTNYQIPNSRIAEKLERG